jgi:hypothetical protein
VPVPSQVSWAPCCRCNHFRQIPSKNVQEGRITSHINNNIISKKKTGRVKNAEHHNKLHHKITPSKVIKETNTAWSPANLTWHRHNKYSVL